VGRKRAKLNWDVSLETLGRHGSIYVPETRVKQLCERRNVKCSDDCTNGNWVEEGDPTIRRRPYAWVSARVAELFALSATLRDESIVYARCCISARGIAEKRLDSCVPAS
jgi:hypothetical protein